MTTLADRLRALDACDPAVGWVQAQPDQRLRALWAACPDGSWLLWALERAGIDCSEMGFVCAERARQCTLRALPSSPERDALARCAPIVDRETAAAAWAAGSQASRAARVAARAGRAAWAARAAARAAEEAARERGADGAGLRGRAHEEEDGVMAKRTSADTEAAVLAAYQRGEATDAIAFEYGLRRSTVATIAKRAGVPMRPPRRPSVLDDPAVLLAVREQVAAGWSAGDIAERWGVSYHAAYAWRRRFGAGG